MFHDSDLLVGPQNASLIRLNEDGHVMIKKTHLWGHTLSFTMHSSSQSRTSL